MLNLVDVGSKAREGSKLGPAPPVLVLTTAARGVDPATGWLISQTVETRREPTPQAREEVSFYEKRNDIYESLMSTGAKTY